MNAVCLWSRGSDAICPCPLEEESRNSRAEGECHKSLWGTVSCLSITTWQDNWKLNALWQFNLSHNSVGWGTQLGTSAELTWVLSCGCCRMMNESGVLWGLNGLARPRWCQHSHAHSTSELLHGASLFVWPLVLHPPSHGLSLRQDIRTSYMQTSFQDHKSRGCQVFCQGLDSVTSPTFSRLKGRHRASPCHAVRGLHKGVKTDTELTGGHLWRQSPPAAIWWDLPKSCI